MKADIGLVPRSNLESYATVYRVETVLRELIIEVLTELEGPRWYKRRLPADVLATCQGGLAAERALPWTRASDYHLIYFSNLPDLRKILVRADNWRDGFEAIFGRKDFMEAALADLEFIRNKVAHCRPLGEGDVRTCRVAADKIIQNLGDERFERLVSGITTALDLTGKLKDLSSEARTAYTTCSRFEELPDLRTWASVSNSWWFDEDYLGMDLAPVRTFFKALEAYQAAPRGRGRGYHLEQFVHDSQLSDLLAGAVQVLDSAAQLG